SHRLCTTPAHRNMQITEGPRQLDPNVHGVHAGPPFVVDHVGTAERPAADWPGRDVLAPVGGKAVARTHDDVAEAVHSGMVYACVTRPFVALNQRRPQW